MRPSVDARRDDVVHRDVAARRRARTSSVGSSTTTYSPAKTRSRFALQLVGPDRREEADAAEVDADHGHVAAEQLRERAQHRPVAAERDHDLGLARVVDERRRPARRRPRARAATASSTSTRPCVTTAAVLTGRDRCVDPLVEVIGKRRVVGLREVEEELPVALRAGKPGVYDADDARPPAKRRVGDLAQDARADARGRGRRRPCRRPRAPPRTAASRARRACQPGAASREAGGSATRTEMNETSQTTSSRRERELRERPRVRALEHDDARVLAQTRVELPVADVDARSRAPRRAAAARR